MGDLDTAVRLMEAAANAGADAFKLQKRTLPGEIPEDQREKAYATPWGTIPYLDYKRKIEFGEDEYRKLGNLALDLGIHFGVSVWGSGSADWAANLRVGGLATEDTPEFHYGRNIFDFLKIPSALITNEKTVHHAATRGLPFFWSTGMSTIEEVHTTRRWLENYGFDNWGVLHCNSSYPAQVSELNLNVIKEWGSWPTWRGHPVGYSGHETGLATTVAAVALGATVVERHITLDRASWGSDQAASVEPTGFRRLVRDIRVVEEALGDGQKVLYDSEVSARTKLRPID